jgi:hypothetical protein
MGVAKRGIQPVLEPQRQHDEAIDSDEPVRPRHNLLLVCTPHKQGAAGRTKRFPEMKLRHAQHVRQRRMMKFGHTSNAGSDRAPALPANYRGLTHQTSSKVPIYEHPSPGATSWYKSPRVPVWQRARQYGVNKEADVVVRTEIFDARSMDPICNVDPRTETNHGNSSAALTPTGPCVQNDLIQTGASCGHYGHSSAPAMSPYRLSLCLIILGWSERELARRNGEHRTTLRRGYPATAKSILPSRNGSRCWSWCMLPAPAQDENRFHS